MDRRRAEVALDPAWGRFVAAERGLAEALDRLRRADYTPAVRRALAGGGDFAAAVELLAYHLPVDWIAGNLDVVLPLAIEGGLEQSDVRAALRRIDPARLAEALPPLVGRVLHGTGDQYLEYAGLLHLLAELGQRRLLHAVLAVARAHDDPEIREAAEPYEGERIDPGPVPPSPGPRRAPGPAEPPVAEWPAFVAALGEYRAALGALSAAGAEFLPAALADPAQRGPALRYLAVLVARDGANGSGALARRVLARLPESGRAEVLAGLADTFLDDPRLWRPEGYRALLFLLGDAADEPTYRLALARGRACPDPLVRIVAETTP